MPGQKKSPAIILDIRRKTKLSRCNQQAYQLPERYLKSLQGGSFKYQTSPHISWKQGQQLILSKNLKRPENMRDKSGSPFFETSLEHNLEWRIFDLLKLIQVNVPFLYPLETSENLGFSDVFRGYGKVTLVWNGLIILQVTEISSLRLVLEGTAGQKLLESSRLELSKKIPTGNVTLSDCEGKILVLLSRGGIVE